MILSQPGSIGMYSPSMMRKKADRRQSKEQLALSVRKHFNSVGVQENDVIVDFIHKVRSHSIAKADRARRPHLPLDLER
jgi:histone deacetylase complex subunit SAP30-like protein